MGEGSFYLPNSCLNSRLADHVRSVPGLGRGSFYLPTYQERSPPPPRAGERVLATPRAVSLFWLCRRTFLYFYFISARKGNVFRRVYLSVRGGGGGGKGSGQSMSNLTPPPDHLIGWSRWTISHPTPPPPEVGGCLLSWSREKGERVPPPPTRELTN